jgi:Tol biopolymer transport system component
MMNMDGSDKVRLTMNDFCNSHASFTPDGQSIVYQAEVDVEGEDHARIFIAPLDSMIAQPDSNWGVNLIDVEGPVFGDTMCCYLKPLVSNDGSKILFMKDDEGDTIAGLFVMNIDGTGVVHISDTLYEPNHHGWSPDGEWVVFQAGCDGDDKARVFIAKADGSEKPVQISLPAFNEMGWCSNWPAWSPDGKWIAYHVKDNNNPPNSIVLYNVEMGYTDFLVSSGDLDICAPTSWDPSSKVLAFKREGELNSNFREICLINIDTKEETVLTTNYRDYRQWFTPDGNGILFKDYPWNTTSARDSGDYDYDLLMISFESDLIPPVVITKDTSINMNGSCDVEITVNDIDNGSWDNVGIVSSSIDITSLDCSDIGDVVEVTLTLEDAAGNSASGVALVTVYDEDVSPPVVITQDISIHMTGSCTAEITADDIDNGSSDNVGIVNMSLDITSFDCSDIGEDIEVTLTCEDAAGNSASDVATVTVLDATATKDSTAINVGRAHRMATPSRA